jgi:hypothetical protein
MRFCIMYLNEVFISKSIFSEVLLVSAGCCGPPSELLTTFGTLCIFLIEGLQDILIHVCVLLGPWVGSSDRCVCVVGSILIHVSHFFYSIPSFPTGAPSAPWPWMKHAYVSDAHLDDNADINLDFLEQIIILMRKPIRQERPGYL